MCVQPLFYDDKMAWERAYLTLFIKLLSTNIHIYVTFKVISSDKFDQVTDRSLRYIIDSQLARLNCICVDTCSNLGRIV